MINNFVHIIDPMNITERLNKALSDSGITRADLARQCGVSRGSVSHWLSGTVTRLSPENLTKAAKVLRVSVSWLATGKEDPRANPTDDDKTQGLMEDRYAFIPRLTVEAAAGTGRMNEHVEVADTLAFRRDWLAKKGLSPDKLELYEAVGESMSPFIEDGDVILVDVTEGIPRNGEVWAIWQEDFGVRVKRISYTERGDVIIRSDNPDKAVFPDEIVAAAMAEDVRTLGKVVWRGG